MWRPKRLFSESLPFRELSILLAIGTTVLILWFSLESLRQSLESKEFLPLSKLYLSLFLFCLPMVLGWLGYGEKGAVGFLIVGILLPLFVTTVLGTIAPVLFVVLQGLLFVLMRYFFRRYQNEVIQNELDIQENEEKRHELDLSAKQVADEAEASLLKCESHYSFREVAERFATTLSLEKLATFVISESRKTIPKGEAYLLYLTDVDQNSLSLIGSLLLKEEIKVKAKKGDLCDLWVLKNRQRLLVTHIKKDFRFDASKMEGDGAIESLILAPLVEEGRVMGILRVHSSRAETFNMEDLRLLDTLATLASPALANALLYKKTEELAIHDSLTGLYVQRYFRERLKEEHRRALLSHTPLSVLMADLDHFKNYNDRFGHGAGDMILSRIADLFKEVIGESGIVARYGGEEFSVILPQTSKTQAVDFAERLRLKVEEEPFEVRREPTRLTLSLGIASLPDDAMELEDLIQKSDQRLYTAKRNGRNRVSAG